MNYHPIQAERERERGFHANELKDCMQYVAALQQDEIDCSGRSGAVMVNPMNKKLVITAAMAYKHLLTDSMYCAALHTPTMLCIDGVAAKIRGDIEDPSENSSLCVYVWVGTSLVHAPKQLI